MMSDSGVRSDLLQRFLDAASTGDMQTLMLMIDQSSDLLNQRGEKGWSALMLAARHGHQEVVKALLENGCDTSAQNGSGQTARDVAVFWGHRHVASLLSGSPDVDLLPSGGVQELDIYFNRQMLDRKSEKRTDLAWISEKQADPDTVFIVFHDLCPLVRRGAQDTKTSVCRLRASALQKLLTHTHTLLVFLGVQKKEVAWFAVSTEDEPTDLLETLEGECFFLQPAMPGLLTMSDEDAGVVAQARSVLAWHSRYRFCPTCGSNTRVEDGGYKRTCLRAGCRSLQGVYNTCYPRVDPVVIMLVIHPDGNQCLLGRKKIFPPGMFSCLAGFIEPGECVEAAVRREVQEESGVQVSAIQYVCSQPWPMPSCLMIGCHCVALTTDINVDQQELEEARWFTRQQVIDALLKHKHAAFIMPPQQAVAHQLIKHWIGFNANL